MLDKFALFIGYAVMAVGGFALFVNMTALFIEIACELAESLAYEYNKNREKFLEWLAKGDEK